MIDKKPILEVKHLEKSFGDKMALKDVSFTVYEREIVGILGHNGAGKTTAFYITMGLIQLDNGSISFHGKDITSLRVDERARQGMGYLAQEPSIFRSLTVEENILMALEPLDISHQEKKERLEQELRELDLIPLRKKKSYLLSGGEKRRLEIARTLVSHPSLILLDEPFAGIDPKTISDVKKMIRMLKNKGISTLICDHNAREIFTLVDRSYLILSGETLTSGSANELMQDDLVRSSYLGKEFSL